MSSSPEQLPPAARDSYLRGLQDPEGSGAPRTPEQAREHFEAGKRIAELLRTSGKSIRLPLSKDAEKAPEAEEHAKLGIYPVKDPTYIR